MSPINTFGILAFASAALAVPHVHDSHRHLHNRHNAHEARAPAAQAAYGSAAPPSYGSSSAVAAVSASSAAPPYPIPSSSGASGWAHATGGWGSAPGYANPTGWAWSASGSASSVAAWSASSSGAATTTAVETVVVSPEAPSSLSTPVAAVQNDMCTGSTITTKLTLTMTVTAHGGSPVAPTFTSSSSSSSPSPPAYSSPASSPAAPSAYSSPSPAAVSSPAAAAWSAAPQAQYQTPSAYSSPAPAPSQSPAPVSSSAGFSGKRGLAYNTASLCTPFIGQANIGWAYNWVSGSAGLDSGIPYIPELHDMTETFTSVWQSEAQAAIDAGSEWIFGFNEPDISTQANLSPEAAAAGWMQYIQPFASQGVKLVAPSVSNSNLPGQGLEWLSAFFAACTECTFDAINLHWYDYTSNDVSSLQAQITQGSAQSNNLPVFIGEFGFIGSDEDISSALEQAMPWLDSQDIVLGYAYYFLDDGLLLDGTTPSAYGATYLG